MEHSRSLTKEGRKPPSGFRISLGARHLNAIGKEDVIGFRG